MTFMAAKINTRLLYTLLSATVVIVGTVTAIQYAKGNYRITNQGFVKETGLLSANSSPTGAQVFIGGKLVTATDDTLYLEPGTYDVEIVKDGYAPWRKSMTIEKELVAQTNALLFPSAPNLTSLTFTGVQNVSPSPDGQKILFYTASASAQAQNGLYVLEMGNNLLTLQRGPRQISEDVPDWNLKQARFIWSPDSNEVMIIANGHQVLMPVDKKQSLLTLPDVGVRNRQILSGWEEELYLRERQSFSKFPPEIIEMATTSARNVYLSADKKRLLYTAQVDTTLPDDIVPPLPATNTQLEERQLKANSVYVYDAEEDKNFHVGIEDVLETNPTALTKQSLATDLYNREALTLEASPSAFARLQATTSAQTADTFKGYYSSLYTNKFQWFPDSKHLIRMVDDQIRIMGYDGTNDTVVYSGPFAENFTYPWPDGSRVVILTTFSPKAPFNLYTIDLK
jgi:hypothetical protein